MVDISMVDIYAESGVRVKQQFRRHRDRPRATYGTMYGMEKTTVYLPSALKRALERAAQLEGRSEAELIREGVVLVTEPHRVADPILPLFESESGDLASRVDELLEGFGEP